MTSSWSSTTETPRADGVLVIDKPAGPTSHDVVQQVRRRLGVRRAGHTGTLDPMATGVLPVVLGEATKLVPLLVGADKVYEAEAVLGVDTDTLDATGRVVAVAPPEHLPRDPAAVAAAVAGLVGRRRQTPPAFSAVKVRGTPLHRLARRGEEAAAPAREVEVYEAVCLAVDLGCGVAAATAPAAGAGRAGGPPRVRFRVACSKGTYVRVLVADLGRALGCGAHLSALRRLRSGPFGLDRAVPLETLDTAEGRARALARLVPPEEAVAHLPAVTVSPAAAARLRQGQAVACPQEPTLAAGTAVRVAAPGVPLLALAEVRADASGRLAIQPTRLLLPER